MHLTQTGNTSALLLRKGYLTNISEDLSPDTLESNPLKTFINISSGKLENHDKLIILTDNILNILDLEEIKNNALNFSEKDFIQFLRTVLVNKLEKAAALIADIKEKEEILLPVSKKSEKLNAFSSSAFSKPSLKREPSLESNAQETTDQFLPAQETPKVGHIYIKEDPEPKKFKKTFSFKKISKVTDTDLAFEIDKSVSENIQNSDNTWFSHEPIEVVIKVGAEVSGYFTRRKILPNQTIVKELAEGGLLVSTKVAFDEEILKIVRYWIPHVKIISPVHLQEKLEDILKKYLKL